MDKCSIVSGSAYCHKEISLFPLKFKGLVQRYYCVNYNIFHKGNRKNNILKKEIFCKIKYRSFTHTLKNMSNFLVMDFLKEEALCEILMSWCPLQ